MSAKRTRLLATAVAAALAVGACGNDDDGAAEPEAEPAPAEVAAPAGLSTVSPAEAAATIADPPADLVILDVRTPDEFASGHVDGAVMIDFYEPDFAAELAALPRDVPYVLYCRSGNRSGQTLSLMSELGFTSVEEIGGGVVAWQDAGLPLTAG